MTTAAQLIEAALEDVVSQGADSEFDQQDYKSALFRLNNMMFAWAADGLNLGYTEVENLSSTLTVPAGAIEAMQANLALKLCPQYGVTAGGELVKMAADGKRTISKIGQSLGDMPYPCTLPIGSGNQSISDAWRTSRYYPDEATQILNEADQAIAVESQTEET